MKFDVIYEVLIGESVHLVDDIANPVEAPNLGDAIRGTMENVGRFHATSPLAATIVGVSVRQQTPGSTHRAADARRQTPG